MLLKWGICSAGKISFDFACAFSSLDSSKHVILCVASKDIERSKEFASKFNIQNYYDSYDSLAQSDVDIVYIGSLNNSHFELAMLMLAHGKHVLCEKPMTTSFEQTSKLIETATSKSLFLQEAFWTCLFPAMRFVRHTIASGTIGQVEAVRANFCKAIHATPPILVSVPQKERIKEAKLGGGVLYDLGFYPIAVASMIYGDRRPDQVTAFGALSDQGVDMAANVTLTFGSSQFAQLWTTALTAHPASLDVYGDKGHIQIDDFMWCPTVVRLNGVVHDFAPLPTSSLQRPNFERSEGLQYEAEAVWAAINDGWRESSEVPFARSMNVAYVIDEARRQLGVATE